MAMLARVLKDPLLHFLVLGLFVFAVYEAMAPVSEAQKDPKRIIVDRDGLLTFLQYRAKVFEPKLAAKRLDAMAPKQLRRLVDDYVREEALYREAQSLGLDSNDYIIQRRMIQKVDFISQGFAEAATKLNEAELREYYAANQDRYDEPAIITFTHVFFNNKGHGTDRTFELAQQKLAELERDSAAFSDAPKHGDRFPYGVNYVERSADYVASHFGNEMMQTLFQLDAADGKWRGPIRSDHGAHVIMLTKNQAQRTMALSEVRGQVLADLRQERIRQQSEAAVAKLVKSYTIEHKLDGRAGQTLAVPVR